MNYDPKKDKCESYKYENSGYSIQYDKKINITKFLKLIKKEDLKLKIKKLEDGFGLFHSIICYNCLNELPKELSTKFIMFEDDYPSKQSGKVFQLVEKLIEEGILIKIPNHDKPIYRINAVKLNKYWNEDSFLKHIEMVVQQKDMLEKNIKEIKKNGLPHIPGCIGIECLAYEILIDLENEEEKNILKQGNIKKGT